ncbi:MAG: C-GCAxxG-C-C family (seleno)protein [Lachnospiraceae bacterium]|uniref:C-GCAxxG-C-C family (seleno)protein n=1 Tax=Parablautia sp. Marseille-Q6255 TaxID=3039593 RepID=UPI0024BC0B4D|nr:C-GCAxxG-C-C family (seleno)protein [Parablautia sp. Marseille-Q6255]
MLKDIAKKYYEMDYNCAESIVHAGNEYYRLGLSEHDMRMTAAFGGGLQVGDVCGALTGAACVVSAKYVTDRAHEQKEELKAVMMRLVKAFQTELGARLCAKIKAEHFDREVRCLNTVMTAAQVLEDVIRSFDEEQERDSKNK